MNESARSFDLTGRTARADYLWFLTFSIIAYAAGIYACIRVLEPTQATLGIFLVTSVFYLPVTSAGVRRLHDVGESGLLMLNPLKPIVVLGVSVTLVWYAFAATFVGSLIGIFAALFFGSVIIAIAMVVALAALFMTLAYFSNTMGLLLLPSQPGPNQYGPNPYEVSQ